MSRKRIVTPVAAFLDNVEDSHGTMAYERSELVLAMYLFMNDTYGLENNELNSQLGNLSLTKETFILDLAKSDCMDSLLGNLQMDGTEAYITDITLTNKILNIEVN